MDSIKLTQYSHGAGCGCKISPKVLSDIIGTPQECYPTANLLVGNSTNDDAAVLDMGDGTALISTTDFFMPIVDSPEDFGGIASVNAISDIYAMGGKPLMAIAILGWPVDRIPVGIAKRVLNGSRRVCAEAGIGLAGGHSIDSPEPIFGLAVTGSVAISNLKRNSTAREGDCLFLTKPLGVGIVTTAQKKGLAKSEHLQMAAKWMLTLNSIGEKLGGLPYVNALTDVTGFGLLGHLMEMCNASGLSAQINVKSVPCFDFIDDYIAQRCVPGGTRRNWDSYGNAINSISDSQIALLADPQTSGGLLISVDKEHLDAFKNYMHSEGLSVNPFGFFTGKANYTIFVNS